MFLLLAKLDQYQCLIKYNILRFDLWFFNSFITGDATWCHGILVTIGTGLKTVLQITTSIITVEPSPKIFRGIHPRTTSREVLIYRPLQWIQMYYLIFDGSNIIRHFIASTIFTAIGHIQAMMALSLFSQVMDCTRNNSFVKFESKYFVNIMNFTIVYAQALLQ